MAANGNWTKSLFVGLWTVLNFTRKLFFNLIFIFIAIAIIVAILKEDDPLKVNKDSALYLSLNGTLVIEKESVDPFEEFLQEALGEQPENPEVLVREVVDVLANAKRDNRIKALVLDLQMMRDSGLDKLRTLARAIDSFKESGKPVYAIGDYYSQSQYYLAAHADNVYLNPEGALMFEGYGRFGMYFKDMLEKLKVTTHVFRVGTYKSAVEPFLRNDMSEEAKQANLKWLNGYWSQYKQDVANARNVPIDNFDESLTTLLTKFEAANGDFATYALENKWVDALKTREQVRQEMIELVGDDNNKLGFNITRYETYAKVINPPIPMSSPEGDKIAIVVAKGSILNGNQKPGLIGGDSTARLLRKARLDDDVKAVVLQVDSPGGSAFASEIIRQEVLELKNAGKPVVASMGTYAASGGYWISANADKIIASPSTITGSIGVFGLFTTLENTLGWAGINTDGVGTTDLSGMSVTKGISPEFGQLIQRSVENNYQDFITMVAEARGMEVDAVDKIAQGRVWIGTDALEIGLVDELGTLSDAIETAAELAQIENYSEFYVEHTLSPQDLFWKEFFGQALVYVAKWQFADSTSPLVGMVRSVLSQMTEIQRLNDPKGVYAMCLQCKVL